MTKAKSYFITGDPEEIDNLEASTLSVSGEFYDGSNTFGSSGQILSSDGTKTVWINASGATVGSATSVGTNLDSTNASRFVTFVETTSGNNIIRVDSNLTYNPSTNTLTAGSFSGSGANLTGIEPFPSGTLMLFQQTAAPTGWTKQTTHNDKALRVVSGSASSGGTTAFTSVFTSRTPGGSVSGSNSGGSVTGSNSGGSVSNHTLSQAEMPSHIHGGDGFEQLRVRGGFGGGGYYHDGVGGSTFFATYENSRGSDNAHNHGFTNPTWSQGTFTNPSWSGSFSGTAMDFAVQYVDLIIASKN